MAVILSAAFFSGVEGPAFLEAGSGLQAKDRAKNNRIIALPYFSPVTFAGIFKNSSGGSARGAIRAISTAPLK